MFRLAAGVYPGPTNAHSDGRPAAANPSPKRFPLISAPGPAGSEEALCFLPLGAEPKRFVSAVPAGLKRFLLLAVNL